MMICFNQMNKYEIITIMSRAVVTCVLCVLMY